MKMFQCLSKMFVDGRSSAKKRSKSTSHVSAVDEATLHGTVKDVHHGFINFTSRDYNRILFYTELRLELIRTIHNCNEHLCQTNVEEKNIEVPLGAWNADACRFEREIAVSEVNDVLKKKTIEGGNNV